MNKSIFFLGLFLLLVNLVVTSGYFLVQSGFDLLAIVGAIIYVLFTFASIFLTLWGLFARG